MLKEILISYIVLASRFIIAELELTNSDTLHGGAGGDTSSRYIDILAKSFGLHVTLYCGIP